MGGHHSTQSISASSSLLTNATLKQTQDCIAVTDGSNVIDVSGNANVLSGVTQNLTFTVKQDCLSKLESRDDFQQKLATEIAASLKDQSVAMMSWLTPGSSRQHTAINNSVTTNVTTETVQKCLSQLEGNNIVNVRGSGNVLSGIVQNMQQGLVGSCMQGTAQTLTAITDISDSINQKQSSVQKNPLSFLTDALQAMVQDIALSVAVIVLAIAGIYAIAKVLKHRRAAAQAPATA